MNTVRRLDADRDAYRLYGDAFAAWHDARLRHLHDQDVPRENFAAGLSPFVLDAERESTLLDRLDKAWKSLGAEAQALAEIEFDAAALKLGVYVHYARGEYTVTGLIAHHETQRPMVKYISHAYGKENARPLRGWPSDADGWNDPVFRDSLWRPRFRLAKVSPFDPIRRTDRT